MALSALPTRVQYTTNGSGNSFPFNFRVFRESNLKVYVDSEQKTVGEDFKIEDFSEAGGTVKFYAYNSALDFVETPLSAGLTVTLLRETDQQRLADYQNQTSIRYNVLNPDFDKIVGMVQDLDEKLGRSITLDPTTKLENPDLEIPEAEPGKFIIWNSAGTNFTNSPYDVLELKGLDLSVQASRNAAQAAQSGAETAKTSAETARTEAETARALAQTARDEAQTALASANAVLVDTVSAGQHWQAQISAEGEAYGAAISALGSAWKATVSSTGTTWNATLSASGEEWRNTVSATGVSWNQTVSATGLEKYNLILNSSAASIQYVDAMISNFQVGVKTLHNRTLEGSTNAYCVQLFIGSDDVVYWVGQAQANENPINITTNTNVVSPVAVALPGDLKGKPKETFYAWRRGAILTDEGDLAMFGYNTNGELGDGTTTTKPYAVLIDASNITPRSGIPGRNIIDFKFSNRGRVSDNANCWALCEDGTLWAWGDNQYDRLCTVETGDNVAAPTQVLASGDAPIQNVKMFDCSTEAGVQGIHAVVSGATGDTVYFGGYTANGQGGVGSTANAITRLTPVVGVPTSGVRVEKVISCRSYYTIADSFILTDEKKAYAAGRGYYSHGFGDQQQTSFVEIASAYSGNITNIWALNGYYNSVFIEVSAAGGYEYYGVGDNIYSRLGVNDSSNTTISNWTALAGLDSDERIIKIKQAGGNDVNSNEKYFGNFTILTSAGSVYAQGFYNGRVTGANTNTHVWERWSLPTREKIVQIGGSGYYNLCQSHALTESGRVITWGSYYGNALNLPDPLVDADNTSIFYPPTMARPMASSNPYIANLDQLEELWESNSEYWLQEISAAGQYWYGVNFSSAASIGYVDQKTAFEVIHVQDEKPVGTAAGTNVVGNQTRTLNTIVRDDFGVVSLSADTVFNVPAGTYWITARAPTYKTGRSRLYLCDGDTGNILLKSVSGGYSSGTDGQAAQINEINGYLTLTSSRNLILRQYTQEVKTTHGLGVEVGSGSGSAYNETYAELILRKVA